MRKRTTSILLASSTFLLGVIVAMQLMHSSLLRADVPAASGVERKLVGTWEASALGISLTITLAPDGQFYQTTLGDGLIGAWKFSNGVLTLTTREEYADDTDSIIKTAPSDSINKPRDLSVLYSDDDVLVEKEKRHIKDASGKEKDSFELIIFHKVK